VAAAVVSTAVAVVTAAVAVVFTAVSVVAAFLAGRTCVAVVLVAVAVTRTVLFAAGAASVVSSQAEVLAAGHSECAAGGEAEECDCQGRRQA
jgi:hypothetical protein